MADNERLILGDLAEITPGPSGSLLDRVGDEPDGAPVVNPSDITRRNQVDTSNLRRLPREEAGRLARFILQQGDIVLVRQGSLGRLALIGRELDGGLYNSSCVRLRCRDSRVLPEYLCQYLSSPAMQEELRRRALPGTVQSLNAKILGSLPVVIPPLNRQRDLVSAVSDIDQLAHVHRATADRLDLLKTTLLDDLLDKE
ncbi:restriction endonuclease subunit S [Nocardia fluminea]|uniref:restriction endonuclease subunit S n=1 Tax=Nocardia fluminea TaxID=134984 RepID=UPI003653A4DA